MSEHPLVENVREAIAELYGCGDISHRASAMQAREEAIANLDKIEQELAASYPDIADVFTAEELWLLYPYAQSEADDRERAERRTFTNCESGRWRSLAAKLRLQIERKKPCPTPRPSRAFGGLGDGC